MLEGEGHTEQPVPVGDKQEPAFAAEGQQSTECLAQGHSEAFCKALPGNPGVSSQCDGREKMQAPPRLL